MNEVNATINTMNGLNFITRTPLNRWFSALHALNSAAIDRYWMGQRIHLVSHVFITLRFLLSPILKGAIDNPE